MYVDKSALAVYRCTQSRAKLYKRFSFAAARSTLTIHKRAALFTRSFCPNHPLARTNNVKRIMKRYGFYGPFYFTGSERSLECRISHPQKCESIMIRGMRNDLNTSLKFGTFLEQSISEFQIFAPRTFQTCERGI